MVKITLGKTSYDRTLAKSAKLNLRNRYYEENPSLNEHGSALLARPGSRKFIEVGSGPIRGLYSQPGSFNDALFVVSRDALYKVTSDGVSTFIGNISGTDSNSSLSMAATGAIGTTPEFLFLADGSTLYVYVENGYARGTLTVSGPISNGDTVVINGVYYEFTTGSVNTGTPAGTVGDPYLVKIETLNSDTIYNLYLALDVLGDAGVQYSTLVAANEFVVGMYYGSTSITIRARERGTGGNAYTTTETGAFIAWGGATLSDGGTDALMSVQVPEDRGAIDVAYVAGYVVVLPIQDDGVKGRFYWINPGEIIIDELDFATAERSPDPCTNVTVFKDQFWLTGTATTEVWYFTGDPDVPVRRLQGILYDRGGWEGTALQVKDSMITVDSDGQVFQIGGGIKRISEPSIEQRIRQAIQQQEVFT